MSCCSGERVEIRLSAVAASRSFEDVVMWVLTVALLTMGLLGEGSADLGGTCASPADASCELFDDVDEFVAFVAVAAGEVDEFSCVFDQRALCWGAGDGDAASASEFEEAFVS